MSVIGLWERGRLRPAFPDSMIRPDGVIVLAGSTQQMAALSTLMPHDREAASVLIIGAGKVGHAASRALIRKGVRVYAIDRGELALEPMRDDGAAVFPATPPTAASSSRPASSACRPSCSPPTTMR